MLRYRLFSLKIMEYCLIPCQFVSFMLTEIQLCRLARFSQFVLRLAKSETRHYYNKYMYNIIKKQKNYEH